MMMNGLKKIGLGISLLGLLACTNGGGSGNQTTVEYMPNMMDAISIKAQEQPMRLPVEGTVARDRNGNVTQSYAYRAYPYTQEQAEEAGQALKNPLPITKDILMQGKVGYETFCSVCHGPQGKGMGSIRDKLPMMAPNYHSDKVKGWPDGRIFHIITRGQNLMSGYSSQIRPEERWAIVHYIRALQRSVDPTDADVEAYKQQFIK